MRFHGISETSNGHAAIANEDQHLHDRVHEVANTTTHAGITTNTGRAHVSAVHHASLTRQHTGEPKKLVPRAQAMGGACQHGDGNNNLRLFIKKTFTTINISSSTPEQIYRGSQQPQQTTLINRLPSQFTRRMERQYKHSDRKL